VDNRLAELERRIAALESAALSTPQQQAPPGALRAPGGAKSTEAPATQATAGGRAPASPSHPGGAHAPASPSHPGGAHAPASSSHPGGAHAPASSSHPGGAHAPASPSHPGGAHAPVSSSHPGGAHAPVSPPDAAKGGGRGGGELAALGEVGGWAELAGILGALGSPVRLTLLQEIVQGRSTVAALSEVDGLGTSGQIYHHLRQLTAEGWLHSPSRGTFAVPPPRVVALLAILEALQR
jgi:hypothetical protein